MQCDLETSGAAPILSVRDLTVGFGPAVNVLQGVSFDVMAGRTLALVGESGSGKTLTCRAMLRLLPRAARIRGGQIMCRTGGAEKDMLSLSARETRDLRGDEIAMIFQEPMRAFSSVHTIGNQVGEMLVLHTDLSKAQIKERVLRVFENVGFPDPDRAFRSYPFELSGGMLQRAMIAMAVISEPRVVIADEPTTALDVTTQAMVLDLLKTYQKNTGMTLILVTHDLGVVANMADDVVVLKKGRVVEAGPVELVIGDPAHSYTKRLVAAAPEIPENPDHFDPIPQDDLLLEMIGVSKSFQMRKKQPWAKPRQLRVLHDLNLCVPRNKTVAIVGESGSGKTTSARIALGEMPADAGSQILFRPKGGEEIAVHDLDMAARCKLITCAQMVFQDPYSTLNPRMTVREALCEPLDIHNVGTRPERIDRAVEILGWVGLSPDMLGRYPHAFSGGQRQRLSIARALMLRPEFVVCDEPTSALDVSVQAQVLELLEDLQQRLGLTYLFISHDLAVVSHIADEVAVMRRGYIVEQGPPEKLFLNPVHPYTKALIAAQPEPDVSRPIDLAAVSLGAGDPDDWPEEFRWQENGPPPLRPVEANHQVRLYA